MAFVQQSEKKLNLYCAAEVVPLALLVDHVLVNLPCRYVVVALQSHVHEPLVVAQVLTKEKEYFTTHFSQLDVSHNLQHSFHKTNPGNTYFAVSQKTIYFKCEI